MRIILIRHGTPDYVTDTLFPEGIVEAEALSQRVKSWKVDEFYVSPLGRAKQTAEIAMKYLDRECKELFWLEEWRGRVWNPTKDEITVPFDLKPENWAFQKNMYDASKWTQEEMFHTGLDNNEQIWRETRQKLDQLLAEYGYERIDGYCYKHIASVKKDQTIVFFCHDGIIGAIMSHLLGISVPALWYGTWSAPTAVTVLSTDERNPDYTRFTMQCMGDCSHLHQVGVQIGKAGYLGELWQG